MVTTRRKPARKRTLTRKSTPGRGKAKTCSCRTKNCAHKVNEAEIKGFERGYHRGLQHGRKGH